MDITHPLLIDCFFSLLLMYISLMMVIQRYTGGRFEVRATSASAMPGVITAIYLSSAEGRKGEGALGNQDEIDFEFKGNTPNAVQTNVLMNGQEDLLLLDVGSNTHNVAHNYAIEWDNAQVRFYVDGRNVRTKQLNRPLAPLKLTLSVWDTVGGWGGLKAWAGDTDWKNDGFQPITGMYIVSINGCYGWW